MKKLFNKMSQVLFLLVLMVPLSMTNDKALMAAQSDFSISVLNLTQPTDRTIEFDVYLLDTDGSQTFELASVQLGFLLSSGIYTGGTLSASISNAGSGLLAAQQFNAAVSIATGLTGYPNLTLLRLAGRTPPGAGNGTIISATGNGTLLTHFTITSTVAWTANFTPDLIFTSSSATNPLYATRVSQYISAVNTALVVTPGTNALICCNPALNSAVPVTYSVTGSGSYCEGGAGLAVGLSGSEIGATYQLFKDGIPTGAPVAGTGSVLSFGNQTAGTYTVTGTNTNGTVPMTGSAIITINLLPTQPAAFTVSSAVVYQGASGIIYSVPIDPLVTYAWSYSGLGATITGSSNSVSVSFSATATSGILSVTANNSCGPSSVRTMAVTVNSLLTTDYLISVQNITQPTDRTIEFDVYLLDTEPSQSLELASVQLGFLLNSAIYTGGTLTASISNTSSGLLASQQFSATPTIVTSITGYPNQTLMRLAGRIPPGAGTGTIISTTGNGTLLTHFTLTSTLAWTPISTPDLIFTSSAAVSPLYATRINEYIGTTNTALVVTPGSNAIICCNPSLNNNPPLAYSVTGGGSYCQGMGGLLVGLDNSEIGVTYTLFKDAVAQVPTVLGTGAAISFGNQLAGTYSVSGTNGGGTTAMTGNAVISETPAPAAPGVVVTDNCDGTSLLTATGFTGTLLWSNGATTASITVSAAGTYTVTQTVSGCTSPEGSGVAAPKTAPAAPGVAVVDNCDGTSLLTATGFTGTLLWSNGATTASIMVSAAGTYTVTQTVSGCTSPEGSGVSAPKTAPAAPGVAVVDNCDGTSLLTATGFTGTLLWSNGATTASIMVSAASTYTVTQTVSGCTSPEGSGVAAPKTAPAAPAVGLTQPTCALATGTITVTGPAAASYSVTGISPVVPVVTNATGIFVGLAPGIYEVTATNAAGCISSPTSATLNPAPNAPAAPGVAVVDNCDGTSLLTATGFTGTLLWSNGATTASITVSAAGTYTVTQTVSGCTSPEGSGVAAPKTAPAAPGVAVVDNCDGTSLLTATGFTGTLLWSNGATTASITVSAAGTYTVTQTVSGCTSPEGSGVAAPKTAPAAPGVAVVDNCDGTSLLTATGFTGTLLWSNGATTASITVSAAGTYTVTQTVSGCTSPEGSGVAAPKTAPAAPGVAVVDNCDGTSLLTATGFTGTLLWSNGATTASITVSAAGTYTVTQTVSGCTSPEGSGVAAPKTAPAAPAVGLTQPTCSLATGTITVTGPAAASYSVTGISPVVPVVTNAMGIFVGLAPGIYEVTATNAAGCISSPTTATLNPAPNAPAAPGVAVVDNCDGTSLLTATGFTGTLLWSNGATTASIMVSAAGTYTVTQTVSGCTSPEGSGVAAPKTAPAAPGVAVVDNCDGTSLLTATGFTGTLLWSNGATTASITVSAAGTYTVTQTVSGCTSPEGSGVAAPKTAPAAPAVGLTQPTCSLATGTITVTGPAAASYSVTGISPVVPVVTNATGIFVGLAPGIYEVTATNAAGCISSPTSATLNPAPNAPAAPGVAVVDNCDGTSLLTATGFTGTLLWSNGATTASITVSAAGTYTVTQTVSGCTSPEGSGVAAPKTAPAAPAVGLTQPTCSLATGTITVTGPAAASYSVTGISPVVPVVTNAMGIFVGLAPGIYEVTATNAAGCISSPTSATLNPAPNAPAAPGVAVVDNCDGTSLLTATGFTGTLLWSNGATTASITVSAAGTYTVTQTVSGCTSPEGSGVAAPKTAPAAPGVAVVDNCDGTSLLTATGFTGTLLWSNGATTASITVSAAGTYTVTQTVSGCTSPEGSGVAAPKTAPAAPAVGLTQPTCALATGTITVTGPAAASYSVTGISPVVPVVTNAMGIFVGLAPGIYEVTATNSAGCISSPTSATLNPAPNAPAAPGVAVVDNCDGTSLLTATGFTGTLLWSNGATTASITVSAAGTYTVTQTVSGCTSPEGSGVAAPKTVPAAPGVVVTDNCDGTSLLTATGFTGILLWSNGATTASIMVSAAGTYTVTQTVSGCTSPEGSGVAAPKTAPVALITNNTGITELTCTVTSISLTASGGDSYSWNSGMGTNASIIITTAGNYQVTVTNANGCSAIASIDITQAPGISNVTASAGTIATMGGTTTLSVIVTGGVAPYTYSLNGATPQLSNVFTVGAGTYTVSVTDANGCTMNSNLVIVSDVVLLPSFLKYTGVLSVQTNSQAKLSATLWNSNNKGIIGKTIQFTVGSQSVTATTNRQGKATASLVINQVPGTYQMITSFAGDAVYAGSSDNDQFTIKGALIPVTASLIGTVTKVYDGNKTAFMLPENYQLTGVTAGDNVVLNNPTTGTYNNKNVGTNKTVTVTGLILTGADAGKYILSNTTASAKIGIITALKVASTGSVVQSLAAPEVKVYPNPFSDRLRFEFVSPDAVNARIDLYDMTGRIVKTIFELTIEGGVSYKAEFKPEALTSGMYFYRMTMGHAVYNGKVMFKKE